MQVSLGQYKRARGGGKASAKNKKEKTAEQFRAAEKLLRENPNKYESARQGAKALVTRTGMKESSAYRAVLAAAKAIPYPFVKKNRDKC
ncbi:hypothetical protein [Paraburkholderia dinghuensis]|uniref:Uncharacterized protein n=1 Tax=Paraburkholderia dinghuensis TaxID=2305225 RepID=A0A3N6M852_9BURK|nr:hypothetical protein [Paraburkholderia dinghuensis]RQG99828.1 hypothetical protein D1Y85_26005 [Paraburkholderia dinghuensis]